MQLLCVFVDRNFKAGNLKVKRVQGQKPKAKERVKIGSEDWTVVWTGQMGRKKDFIGKGLHKYLGKERSRKWLE